jgi:hypothetical protein
LADFFWWCRVVQFWLIHGTQHENMDMLDNFPPTYEIVWMQVHHITGDVGDNCSGIEPEGFIHLWDYYPNQCCKLKMMLGNHG